MLIHCSSFFAGKTIEPNNLINGIKYFSVVLMFYKNQMTKMWPVLYVTVASCDHICGMSGEL